ncbi:response regulator [Belnapia sp. T18]|uniref:histidine kinase n=1 Tax=Belnapia arida TaxID=2804533 RepID=A0ABS1U8G0_9PROT|nr:response regulator [Belnapia arida]MBL6080805.1 response regulator [Belnapia arida]
MDLRSSLLSNDTIRHGPRIRALQRTGLLDTPPEETFDRVTRLVCRVLRVPVALVSLVDANRQFFKSATGLPEPWASRRETPLSHSFCQHVVTSGTALIVEDARSHLLVRDNLAIPDLGVVAYLGMPLALPDGQVIGALCAIDTVPHHWTTNETETLRDLATIIMDEIALRQLNGDLEARVGQEVAAREAALVERAKARRLEALSQLAGSVAHDMNNVLQAAGGGIRLAIRRLERDPATARHLLDAALEALDRGASVTRRLLSLAGRGVLFPEPLNVAALLADLRGALSSSAGGVLDLRVAASDDLPPILADRTQLEAALNALAANAREAMPDGGALTLGASTETVCKGIPHRARLKPGTYIRLKVIDNGTGMSAETLAQAPEPFFTTKDVGKATGLGLATSRSFAEQSGGGLAIESEPGRGTTVTLWLPQAGEEDAGEEDPGQSSPPASPPGRRILLVDDDPLVLRVFKVQLAEAGHAVLAAGGGAEALAMLDRGEAVDLLVTDLSMPGMDGVELIRAAQGRRPGLPAVLITGHPVNAAAPADEDARAAAFQLMHKPVSGPYLADRIATMLHSVPPP